MSTLDEQLTLLENTKSSIKQAIIDKGQVISTSDSFASYTDKINNISTLEADTADATATAPHILTGETAYVQGQKITGNMPNLTNKAFSKNPNRVQVGKNEDNIVTMVNIRTQGLLEGFVDKSTIVYNVFNTTKEIKMLADGLEITPDKLKKGENILNVIGTYEGSSDYDAKLVPTNGAIAKYITEISENLDTSSVTDMQTMFMNCTNLTTIPLLDTSNVTNMNSMFYGCTNLTTIPLLNTSSVTNMYNMFNGCSSLSDESLNNILAMCANTTHMSTKILAYIGLTSDQANKCKTLSNYSAFTAAGWTTGY